MSEGFLLSLLRLYELNELILGQNFMPKCRVVLDQQVHAVLG